MFPHFLYLLFHAVYKCFDLYLFRYLRIQPVHTSDVGTVIEAKFSTISQKLCRLHCARGLNQQGMLAGRTAVGNDLQAAAGNSSFDIRFNLFQHHLYPSRMNQCC